MPLKLCFDPSRVNPCRAVTRGDRTHFVDFETGKRVSGKIKSNYFADCETGERVGSYFEGKYMWAPMTDFDYISVWQTNPAYKDIVLTVDAMNDLFCNMTNTLERDDCGITALSLLKVAKNPIFCLCGSGGEDTFNKDYGFLRYTRYPVFPMDIEKKPFMGLNLRKVRNSIPKLDFDDVVLFADYTKRMRSLHGGILWAKEMFEKNGKEGNIYTVVDCDNRGTNFSPMRRISPCTIYNRSLKPDGGLQLQWHISDISGKDHIDCSYFGKKTARIISKTFLQPEFYTSTYFEAILQTVGDKPLEQLKDEALSAHRRLQSEDLNDERLSLARYAAKYAVEYARGFYVGMGNDILELLHSPPLKNV